MNKRRITIIFIYVIILFIIALFPFKEISYKADHTYFFEIRLDHIFHTCFFLPWMSFQYYFSQKKEIELSGKIKWYLSGLLLAFCTEGIQYFTFYRSFTLLDLLSNFTGVTLSWICLPLFKPICILMMPSGSSEPNS